MLNTRSELLEKIRLGEDSYLELKEVRFAGSTVRGPSQESVADELAAFANSAGGVLLLGVNDAREVVGIPIDRLDPVEALLRQACEDSIRPTLAPIIERISLPDLGGTEQPVIRVEVSRSLFVHQSPSGYLHRVGSSKRPIAPDHLARLFQQRSQSRLIRFDETPVPRAVLTELDDALWRRFASSSQASEPPEVLLGKLAMAAQDEQKVWRPTVAGLLMGSKKPQQHLTNAFIQAVAYRGINAVPSGDTSYQRDAQDIYGPLDLQIADACAFVRKNMQVPARKRATGGREDLPQFDMLAVFEAVTNAVAHRDYSMAGAKIRLRQFDDRLELYSPGMLPNTMTTDSLPYRQAARNEALTSLLARCPVPDGTDAGPRSRIMDKRGEGVSIILNKSEQLAGTRPVYRMDDDSELILTIYAASAAGEDTPP
ncbi:ATP-binding protein [Ramlibacter sp.]|uniref:ATP-binding protein n=1 Tax=Ramlibacter sp. TaxID=1917967 RepID=UPI003D151BA3